VGCDLNGPGQFVIIFTFHLPEVCCDVSTFGFLIPISVNAQMELVGLEINEQSEDEMTLSCSVVMF